MIKPLDGNKVYEFIEDHDIDELTLLFEKFYDICNRTLVLTKMIEEGKDITTEVYALSAACECECIRLNHLEKEDDDGDFGT